MLIKLLAILGKGKAWLWAAGALFVGFIQIRYLYVKNKLARIHKENLEQQRNAYKNYIDDDAKAVQQGEKDIEEGLKKADVGRHNPHRGDE